MIDQIKLINKKIGGFPEEPHYLVGGKKIYNWVEAFEAAEKLTTSNDPNEMWHHLNFRFGMEVKGQEPKETIRELYIQRAKQIRQQFKYVRLWVSGGTDSTNTIETFINAGVAPDELATYYQWPGSPTTDTNPELITLAAYLDQKKIRDLWPNCKIQTYYMFPDQINWYMKNHIKHYLGTRSLFLFSQCFHNIFECYPKMLTEHGTSIVELFSGPEGIDIGRDEKGWYYNFVDKSFNLHLLAPNQRFFHTDPQNPELLLKIVHICKKAYQEANGLNMGHMSFELKKLSGMQYYLSKDRIYDITNKEQKGLYWGTKSFTRIQNMFSSEIGFDSLMRMMSLYKELQDNHSHWFHDKQITNSFIGQKSQRVYFED